MTIFNRNAFQVSFVMAISLVIGGTGQYLLAQSVGATVKPSPPELRNRILTPPAPATPRINGARIYGQRPGRPFLFTVPTTGERPIEFSADDLPMGLTIDKKTGQIGGIAPAAGDYLVTLHAKNNLGSDSKPLKIVIGETIALTPPMGWNSWNCWAKAVDQEKVLRRPCLWWKQDS